MFKLGFMNISQRFVVISVSSLRNFDKIRAEKLGKTLLVTAKKKQHLFAHTTKFHNDKAYKFNVHFLNLLIALSAQRNLIQT